MKKYIAILLSGLILISMTGCQKETQPPLQPQAKKEDVVTKIKAPSFTASGLFEEKPINFPDDYQGKLVYMTFFSPT